MMRRPCPGVGEVEPDQGSTAQPRSGTAVWAEEGIRPSRESEHFIGHDWNDMNPGVPRVLRVYHRVATGLIANESGVPRLSESM